MLEEVEEQEVGEGEAIPMEVIKSFLQKKEETTLRRQELRLRDFYAVLYPPLTDFFLTFICGPSDHLNVTLVVLTPFDIDFQFPSQGELETSVCSALCLRPYLGRPSMPCLLLFDLNHNARNCLFQNL